MALLQKKSIGLDVADNTIEAVELENSGMGIKVLNTSRIFLPNGAVEGGRIKDEKILMEYVKNVLLKAQPKAIVPKKIVFGLPEAQTFFHIFSLSAHNKKDRDELVLQEAKFNIPLKEDDLSFAYKIISQSANNTKILIAAASKTVVREWFDFFAKLKIEVEFFDIETLAVYRGLFENAPTKPICVVDIGARTVNISIFGKSGLFYSFSSSIAGNHFTDLIAQALGVTFEEAEQKKIKDGLKSRNKKVFVVLDAELKKLENYLTEALLYFKNNTGFDVEEIILVGGSANLKGLIDHLKTKFIQSVAIGASRFNGTVSLEYIEAVGLALRSMVRDEISIPTEDKKTPNIKKKISATVLSEAVQLEKEEVKEKNVWFKNKTILLLVALIFGLIFLFLVVYWLNQIKIEKINAQNNMRNARNTVVVKELDQMIGETSVIDKFVTSTQKVSNMTVKIINTKEQLVNVYVKPDVYSSVIAQIGENFEFGVLEIGLNIDWYKLKINNEVSGWVQSQYVKK